MRYALVALAFTAACAAPSADSTDSLPSQPASSASGGHKPAIPIVDPDPDAPAPAVNVPARSTTCTSLAPETGALTQEWKASPAPAAAAGGLKDGTFVLRTVTEHATASAEKPTVETSGPNVTARFSADGTFEEVMPSDGDAYRTSGRWSIDGDYIELTITCSGAPGLNEGFTTRHRYSATANSMSLYEDDANGVVRVSTFVRK